MNQLKPAPGTTGLMISYVEITSLLRGEAMGVAEWEELEMNGCHGSLHDNFRRSFVGLCK